MNDSTNILPGTRVRAGSDVIGTVERLEERNPGGGGQPDYMVVRSQDAQTYYSIPLMRVSGASQEATGSFVTLDLMADEIRNYADVAAAAPTTTVAEGAAWATTDQEGVLHIPLAAEELIARKQPIELGQIHVHKGVETAPQNLNVSVSHEEAVVEHIPVDQYDANAPTSPNEIIIPVVEEQIVVEKKSVVKEYIRIRKNVVTQQHEVRDVVRREFVEVTEQRQNGAGAATLLHNAPADPSTVAKTTGVSES